MVDVIHMTEWKIRLTGKILNGVCNPVRVRFNGMWVRQVSERVETWSDSQYPFRLILT